MQVALGRCARTAEFRRQLLGLLNDSWQTTCWPTGQGKLSLDVLTELLAFCCTLPLAHADMRLSIDGAVSVSDASESGGGACLSSG
eukprot:2618149-Karenia_brevis.AAC.1